MAVRVTPARGMNGLAQKNFEAATKYEVKDTAHGLVLNIYEGTKKVSTYGPGCWESVDLYTPIDQARAAKKVTKSARKKAAALAGGGSSPKTKSRNGDRIRTSPARGAGGLYGPGEDY
jgi:hypothetical protein